MIVSGLVKGCESRTALCPGSNAALTTPPGMALPPKEEIADEAKESAPPRPGNEESAAGIPPIGATKGERFGAIWIIAVFEPSGRTLP